MGNYGSKISFYNNDQDQKPKTPMSDESFNSEKQTTPPPAQRKLIIDPRSATSGIPRTPIEVNTTPPGLPKRVSAIPKYLQKKPYLETDIDVVIPPLSPKKGTSQILEDPQTPVSVKPCSIAHTLNVPHSEKPITPIDEERYKILGLDPRSPAADFDRTPILMPKSLERLKARSHENLSKRGSYDGDMFNSRFSYCEVVTSNNIQEIQTVPCIENYIDTEETKVVATGDKSDSSFASDNSSFDTMSESGDEITVIRNPKIHSSATMLNMVDIALSNPVCSLDKQELLTLDTEKSNEEEKTDNSYSKQSKDMSSVLKNNDKIKVWSDASLSTTEEESIIKEIDTVKISEQTSSDVPKEEIIILFDDDTVVKNTGKTENENSNWKKQCAIGKKKKNLKTDIKLLTDDRKFFSPENKKGADLLKNRTPLGNRSNNGQVQMLSTKSPQQLLRSKAISIREQQENTPPHKRSITARFNLNGTNWDPDSTVII